MAMEASEAEVIDSAGEEDITNGTEAQETLELLKQQGLSYSHFDEGASSPDVLVAKCYAAVRNAGPADENCPYCHTAI